MNNEFCIGMRIQSRCTDAIGTVIGVTYEWITFDFGIGPVYITRRELVRNIDSGNYEILEGNAK